MKNTRSFCIAAGLFAVVATSAGPASLEALQGRRRVLLVSMPSLADPRAALQRRILTEWSVGAADRDLSIVEVSGSHVLGATESAASLRRRYALKPGAFQVLLIGKDGHVALVSAQPIDAATLRSAIDAMPMRRAGGR